MKGDLLLPFQFHASSRLHSGSKTVVRSQAYCFHFFNGVVLENLLSEVEILKDCTPYIASWYTIHPGFAAHYIPCFYIFWRRWLVIKYLYCLRMLLSTFRFCPKWLVTQFLKRRRIGFLLCNSTVICLQNTVNYVSTLPYLTSPYPVLDIQSLSAEVFILILLHSRLIFETRHILLLTLL